MEPFLGELERHNIYVLQMVSCDITVSLELNTYNLENVVFRYAPLGFVYLIMFCVVVVRKFY